MAIDDHLADFYTAVEGAATGLLVCSTLFSHF